MKKYFKNVEFDEKTHSYIINGKKAGISTTELIGQYVYEFDENDKASKTALKENKTTDEILDLWHYKRDYACERGNQVHLYCQSLWSGKEYKLDYNKIDSKFVQDLKKELPILFKQCDSFYNTYKEFYDYIEDEQYLYDEDYDVAGSIDLLLQNKLTKKYAIIDLKTYSDLNKRAYNNFKIPLQEFKNDNIHHLSAQVIIYQIIFEKYTKLKVDEKFGVYFNINNEDFEIIEIENMQNEVKKILENRRVKYFMENNMSVPILVIGKSGSGKSTSLRNFNKDEIAVINVLGKPLPFKSEIKAVKCNDYTKIIEAIKKTKKKTIVIDDSNYLMTQEFMAKAKQTGYTKFTEIALNFYNLIEECKNVGGGKTIYFFMHEETSNDGSIVKPKTIGQMLDSQVCIEGIFTICLRAMCSNGNYIFSTKTNGQDCVKTPYDMYEVSEVPNDLKEVDKVIREYYDLDKIEVKEEKEIKKEEEEK